MKKIWILTAAILVLGAVGFWQGRPLYRQWKQERLVAQAWESLRQGDGRRATLSARQALAINAGNVEACRIMATVTDALHSPAALDWWQRVVELEPASLTNRLELARSSIRQGDYARAVRTLRGVDKAGQSTAAFHQMAAMAAMGLNQIAVAERHFTEAVRLDPQNNLLKLNQAVIHLQATNQQVVAGALKTLEQLYADPANRKHALRHLAMAASRDRDFAKAGVFTKELQADPKAPLSDQFLHLGVLKDSESPEFRDYLEEMKSACGKDADRANRLSAWMLANGLDDEAGRWLADLPAELQARLPVALARADCYMALNDWTGLQNLLQDAQWEEFNFLRLAMQARAARGLRQEYSAQSAWRSAVRAATDRPKQLGALARMASQWGWEKEREETLWLLVQRFPAERWALESLHKHYLAAGNTRGLYKVYAALASHDPNDPAAGNNLAMVSLLLNLQTNQAHDLARAAWLKATNNTAFASTYAWSLHLRGRTAEGLRVLEALPPGQLEQPGVALYYGAMQAAANEPVTARKFLSLAEAGSLLPEEKSLLAAAKKGL